MSYVTDTILTYSLRERQSVLDIVNEKLLKETLQTFVLTSDVENSSGGNKKLQANVAMAAFNYVEPAVIAEALQHIAWEAPECVHLFVQEEHDEEGFHEVDWRSLRKETWDDES